jgi:catechol 2,3-dioxygenase-like lactoylglutathione lyase family enzyme
MLKFNHVGVAVKNIDEVNDLYKKIFKGSEEGGRFEVASQSVNVAFLKLGKSFQFEFVQPTDESSPVNSFIKRKTPFYHIAFLSSEFDKDIEYLENCGLRPMDVFRSEAFEMKRCLFFVGPDNHLIEVVEE